MVQLKGADASHWTNVTDWNALAKAIDFIYLKATEGNKSVDPKALDFHFAAVHAGLKVGFYHFFRPTSVEDAIAEGDFFVSQIGHLHVDLPYVLDVETNDAKLSKADLSKCCVAFLQRVTAKTGKPAMVYTYDSFIGAQLDSTLGHYPLWLADYGDHKLSSNPVWHTFVGLQYTESGHVAGIAGNADLDLLDDNMVIRPPAPPKPAAPLVHKVVAGDTLSEIATSHGTTVDALKKLNKITDVNHIEVGQVIKLK